MTQPKTRAPRICRCCDSTFYPSYPHHYYCTEKCRLKSKWKRASERNKANDLKIERVPLAKLIASLQMKREADGLPRLEQNRYLETRAEIIEAEQQVHIWTALLQKRRTNMSKFVEPSMERKVVVLRGNEPMVVPPHVLAYGATSTDGILAVVVFGCTPPKESLVNSSS
jgi:hypothetical protein